MTENLFFESSLNQTDPSILDAVKNEFHRQNDQIELIASENIVSKAVLEAQGTVLTNKYAEGYSGKRYYGGCEHVDVVEDICIERVKKLFGAKFANVQVHSGSQANQAVFLALLKPGDTIMGMSLAAGGHLTHGAPPNESGKWFNAIQYGVRREDALIDYEEVEKLANENKPKLIIAGGSSYPRVIDFAKFQQIAKSVGAMLLVDMAHFAGLVATGLYPNPLQYADVVTTTTHKTLRGPRGGLILTNNENYAKKINSAVFPGLQGGPLMHVICAKAVAFGEALKPDFKVYIKNVINNAKVLSKVMINRGLDVVSGGTDTHLTLVDLRPKNLTGKAAERSLENAGITCNKNGVPFDPQSPFVTSGIRLGTPAGTSRGFGEEEFEIIGNYIGDVLDGLSVNPDNNSSLESEIKLKVKSLCRKFPIYTSVIS
ncbi:MAG: serine hydroxymethyltransferase [Rickettsiales bacterium]|nr:serine hydroxymethyltransferase [Rickettsiales bacterium]|tara:strand:+ start:122 stop:1408 length:1287 start_codon:yes stop_codon:yes gene_type:complete